MTQENSHRTPPNIYRTGKSHREESFRNFQSYHLQVHLHRFHCKLFFVELVLAILCILSSIKNILESVVYIKDQCVNFVNHSYLKKLPFQNS